MHRCGISLFRDRQGQLLAFIVILMMASFMIHAFTRLALAQVPLEGQSEVIEKSLRQSLPKELPPKPKAPEITNKSKPSPGKAPAAGPNFFIKEIKLTGNTVISDERLMPLVDLGEGKDVNLNILNAIADKVAAVYAADGYFLVRVFVPNQEIKDATVEMVISEGRVNKVLVQGNKTLSTERTQSLGITIDKLIPISGKTRVVYVFGYKSKQLMQVNILIGHPVDTNIAPQQVVDSGNLLGNHFFKKRYQEDGLVAHARLNDGSVLIFRGKDQKGRMALLRLSNPQPNEGDKEDPKITLSLSYIEKPEQPDAFQLKEDDF